MTTIVGIILTGCASTELQTNAKLTKSVILDHSQNESKNIYLQVTNTSGSGGENMQLYSSLKQNLENKGYTVVNTSKNATYGLFLNVLFANNLKEANAIKSGAGLGVSSGTIASASGNSTKDSLLIGAAAAIGGAVIGKALEDDIFRAVVDITIRDYHHSKVKTQRIQSDSGAAFTNTKRSGNLNQLAGPVGNKDGLSDIHSSISDTVSSETIKNYEEYKTCSFVEAIKMDLKLDEALPILEAKLTRQIANLF